jgi:hypothetical protein
MRRLIRNSLKVIALAAVLYAVGIFLLANIQIGGLRIALATLSFVQRNGGHEERMFQDLNADDQQYDAIVLGSSHAYRGYDPRIFDSCGVHLFVAGSSAQNPIGGKIIYESQLKGRTKVIIQDIYDVLFEIDCGESNLRLIQNLPSSREAWDLTKSYLDMRTFTGFLIRSASIHPPQEIELKEYVERGYCEKKGILYQLEPVADSIFNRNEDVFVAFEAFIKELQADGVQLVLVSHPMPQSPGMATYHTQFLNEFMSLVEKYRLSYFDYTLTTEGYGRNEFADNAHLNRDGVAKYNALLLANPDFRRILGK